MKLVTVTNKDIISSLNRDDITLLYPLKDYSIGYTYYFNINDIDDYVLINRILTDSDLDKLNNILHESNIKGIVFDDLGILDIIKDMNITKILLLDHIACNYESINYYLEYVDSVVVSNDLTKDEIKEILDKSNKKLVVNVFGLKTLMYSRRNLVDNYNKYYKLNNKNILDTKINNKYFKVIDDLDGTKIYAYPYYDGMELLKLNNVFMYWYDPILLDNNLIKEVVLNDNISNIETSKIFLDTKTIYKVGDLDA